MPAALTVVHTSAATAVVLVAAPVIGLLVLLARMFGRSGRIRMSLAVLRRSRADVATLALYDTLGGALTASGFLVLGVTRPPALVAGFRREPLLAWTIVGAFGPLVSAGVIDRLPLRGIVDFAARATPARRNSDAQTMLAEMRFQASRRIFETLYEDVRVRKGCERDDQCARAQRLVEADHLHFDDVAHEIREFCREWRRKPPSRISELLRKRDSWPIDQDPGRETMVLVETAVIVGLSRPVEIACRIGESRSRTTTRTR